MNFEDMEQPKDVVRYAREMWQTGEKNVGETERVFSIAGGVAAGMTGIKIGGLLGITMLAAGAALVYRGATGQCSAYKAMGIDTTETDKHPGSSLDGQHSIKAEQTVFINKSASELFTLWRDFTNLPQVMDHLESVTILSDRRSHWVAKAPAGQTVEWDAEIINEEPDRLIAWRSLPGADVDNAGSVRFEPQGSGTNIKVTLRYDPPAGRLGAMVAKLFGEEPDMQLKDDLNNFKKFMESGVAHRSGSSSYVG